MRTMTDILTARRARAQVQWTQALRSFAIMALLAGSLILSGCSWLRGVTSESASVPPGWARFGKPSDARRLTQQPKHLELADVYAIDAERKFHLMETQLFYENDGAFYVVVEEGFPKAVGFDSDKSRFAYIDRFGFEQVGDLWLIDLDTLRAQPVTRHTPATQTTTRAARWIDDDHIVVEVAFPFGAKDSPGKRYIIQLSDGAAAAAPE